MKIRISNGLIAFDDISVRYQSEYLSLTDLIDMFEEWIRRLRGEISNQKTIYLPFSIDEKYIEAFEVTERDSRVSLRVVKLDGIGYMPGVDSLSEAFRRERPVVERRAKEFLICDRMELIEAVEQAVAC